LAWPFTGILQLSWPPVIRRRKMTEWVAPCCRQSHETPRVHHAARRLGCGVAARGAGAAAGDGGDRIPQHQDARNVAIEYRWAFNEYDRLQALAADLVRRQVTVIAAIGSPSAPAAKAATTTIPIVFIIGFDPVEVGLVTSLNRSGGNVTGVTFYNSALGPKRIGLLREVVPNAAVIVVLVNPNNPNAASDSKEMQDAGRSISRGREAPVVPRRGCEGSPAG
jgi:ABC transporter substrate binding protein